MRGQKFGYFYACEGDFGGNGGEGEIMN